MNSSIQNPNLSENGLSIPITKKDALDSLNISQKIFDACGPRPTGSPNDKKTAYMIKDELNKYCDHIDVEEFKVHRGAAMSFMKVLAVGYVLGTLSLMLGGFWVLLATILYTFSFIYINVQFSFLGQFFDPLFKPVTGFNIIGTIEPINQVKNQIIICAHHDSGHIFSFLQSKKLQRYYSQRINSGLFPPLIAMIGSWFWSIFFLITSFNPPIFSIGFQIFTLIGLIPVIPLFFFFSDKMSPGIGDNLNSSSMIIKLAEIFGTAKKHGNPYLNQTRLILISTDSEEEGLRGSRNYVKRHKTELKALPTYAIVPECIYKLKDLQISRSDLNGFLKLSKTMYTELQDIAKYLGYHIPLFKFPFGGGGTDAAEFAREGVEAVALVGMGTTLVRENLVYHTSEDIVEKIEPEVVEASLKIMMGYILKKDTQTS